MMMSDVPRSGINAFWTSLFIYLLLGCCLTPVFCPPLHLSSARYRIGGQIMHSPPHIIKRDSNAPISASSVGNYTGLNNPAAAGLWISIASKMRLSFRGSFVYIPLSNSSSPTEQTSAITKYYTPLLVYVIYLILMIFFTVISYCCLCYCPYGCIGIRAPHGKYAKITAWTLYGIHYIFVLVGTVGLCWGAAYLATCAGYFQASFNSLISNTNSFALGLSPAANNSFTTLESGIVNASQVIQNFANYSYLQTQVQTPLYSFADSIDTLNVSVTYLNANVSAAATYRANMIVLAVTISATITSLNSLMSDLVNNQQIIPSSTSEFYQVNSGVLPAAIDATSLNTQVNGAPNTSSSFSALNDLSLTSYAATARTKSYNIISNVTNNLQNGSLAFRSNILPLLESARLTMTNSLTNLSNNTVLPRTTSLQSTINAGFLDPITSNVKYENGILIALGCIIGIIPLISVAAVVYSKPKIVKGCAFVSLPLYLVLQLLAIVFVILSAVFGDVCTLVFEGDPVYVSTAISGTDQISSAVGARDQCYNGVSLLQVAINYNLADASSINFTQQAITQINKADFSSLSNFDFSNGASLGTSPSVKLAPLINLNTSNISTTALDTLLNTTLPNFQQAVTSYGQAVTILSTSASASQLTFTPVASPSAGDQQSAVTAFKAILSQQVLNKYLAWINGNLSYLNGNATALNSTIVTLISAANATSNLSSSVSISYNAVTAAMQLLQNQTVQNVINGISSIQNIVIQSTIQVDKDLNSALNCQAIAVDLFNLQNTVCTGVMSGFDSIWLALSILALTSAVSMIIYVFLSRSEADSETSNFYDINAEKDKLLDLKRTSPDIPLAQSPALIGERPTIPRHPSSRISFKLPPVVPRRNSLMDDILLSPSDMAVGHRNLTYPQM